MLVSLPVGLPSDAVRILAPLLDDVVNLTTSTPSRDLLWVLWDGFPSMLVGPKVAFCGGQRCSAVNCSVFLSSTFETPHGEMAWAFLVLSLFLGLFLLSWEASPSPTARAISILGQVSFDFFG